MAPGRVREGKRGLADGLEERTGGKGTRRVGEAEGVTAGVATTTVAATGTARVKTRYRQAE